MKTLWQVVLVCMAVVALWWAGGIVLGIVGTILHYALVLAIVGGVVYVGYSLANPRKSLGGRYRILP
jgi:hypothetical protein